MSDLLNRAIRFAKETHQRIDQRRKYSDQPYSVHLEQVAKIVASVTDDQEMIASAWLHDVVEDTPATLDDIEHEFGVSIAQLVRELTDISKPTDGNREMRKAIDREHLAKASGRAQTIKLADLIDNCKDITRHDTRFARVYVNEMDALLSVLTKADERLMRRAHLTMAEGAAYIDKSQADAKDVDNSPSEDTDLDAHTPVAQVRESLSKHRRHLATMRRDGEVAGFIVQDRLGAEGHCC